MVIVDMVNDSDVRVGKDEMVKRRFLDVVRPLAPWVTCSISNLRHAVNEAWSKRKQIR